MSFLKCDIIYNFIFTKSSKKFLLNSEDDIFGIWSSIFYQNRDRPIFSDIYQFSKL